MSRQRLGQHFLVKGSVLERIAAAACPQRERLVIEIGPGKGALTERLVTLLTDRYPYSAPAVRDRERDEQLVLPIDELWGADPIGIEPS